jgi:hypothetical protein
LTPIPFPFIQERVSLSWRDALWGYEHQMIGWSGIVDLAKDRLCASSDRREIELSCHGKSETPQIGELLRDLAASELDEQESTSVKKWLFLTLAWIFDQKDRIDDPLGDVEKVYADFDYPIDIENFVRYMPVTDSYDPRQHGGQQNENRLFTNWKEYLDATWREVGAKL